MKRIFLLFLVLSGTCQAQAQSGISNLPTPVQVAVDSLHQLVERGADDTLKVERLNLISELTANYALDVSLKNAKQAFDLSEKIHWQPGVAKACNDMAYNYFISGDYSNQYFWTKKGLTEALASHRSRLAIVAYNNLGSLYNMLGDYSLGLAQYNEALKLNRALKDRQAEVYNLTNIGSTYAHIPDYKSALTFLTAAMDTAMLLGNGEVSGSVASVLGNAYKNAGDRTKAAYYLLKSERLLKAASAHKQLAATYNHLAQLHLDERNLDSASAYIEASNQMAVKSGDKNTLAGNYIIQADINRKRGNYGTAITTALKGLEKVKELRNLDLERSIYLFLDEVYEKQGESQKALTAYKNYKIIDDSILSQSKQKEILSNTLQTDFTIKENKLKDDEENRAKLAQADIEKKKEERNAFFLIGLLALMSFIIAYRNYQSERASKKIIQQKSGELEIKTQQLEESNAVKNKLFSIISHDLRSPLVNIDTAMKLLETDDLTVHEFKALAPQLSTSVNTTLNLLDNLLIWSMSQIDGLNLDVTTIYLAEIVNENISLFRAIAAKKNISFLSDVNDGDACLGDKNILMLVVRNLVNNAVKFTRAGGEIKLFATRHNGSIILNVQDNGIGIDSDRQSQLFKLGAHKGKLGTAKEKGTGLGLALCTELLHKMGSHITVNSTPGKGSTFSIELRLPG